MSGSTCAPTAEDGNCLPTGWAGSANTLLSACITSTTGPTCTGSGVSEVFAITGGCSCTFVALQSRISGVVCGGFFGAGIPTVGPTTVSFPALGLGTYTSFKFVLTCG